MCVRKPFGLRALPTAGSLLLVVLLVILSYALLSMGGCVYVIPMSDRISSQAMAPDADTRIGRILAAEPSDRGLFVEDPHQALTTRLDLIEAADRSIDVQYFIWQNDPSGILVIDRLLAAADRGVRIRALIDDVQIEGLVSRLAAIGDHPNIEIRIFNPFSVRLGFQFNLFRLAEFAIDGHRLNHRMHNKLIVVDNQVAMLGGRNIGDDYFGRSEKRNFIDSDIMLMGSPVEELSGGFDRYWNSHWAVPVEKVFELTTAPDDLDSLRRRIDKRLEEFPEVVALVDEYRVHDTLSALMTGALIEESMMVVDNPDLDPGDRPIAEQLTEIALATERSVRIVSPYVVLTPNLLEIGQTLVDRGVKVEVITNSLASNDVVIAHAAYARYRQTILDTGVDLYEFRGDPEMAEGVYPDSDYCLHAKYIVFDDDNVFIGSLNLDPRSLYLNTELGIVLRSPELARKLTQSFYIFTDPANAWKVTDTEEGPRWTSSAGTLDEQPAKSFWQNFRSKLMMLLPVSNQL